MILIYIQKQQMENKTGRNFVILDTIGTANQEMFKIDNTFQHTEVGGTDIGTIYIGKPDSSTATLDVWFIQKYAPVMQN